MLASRTLLDRDGVTIRDVRCREELSRGHHSEPTTAYGFVFVRHGTFVRSADGMKSLFDPTVAYWMNPGEEESFHHPRGEGDDCTAVSFEPSLAASLCGEHGTIPSGPFPTSPHVDLKQRLLLAASEHSVDPDALVEQAIAIAAEAMELMNPQPIAATRQDLVDGARDLLAADHGLSLSRLATQLAVSPHHLSRTFSAATGHTISRHRMRLRARAALERLAGGERDLAALAADLGLFDQSHLCRVIRDETGQTPSFLRDVLTGQKRP